MHYILSALLRAVDSTFEPVEFSGIDILKYYWHLTENNFAGYSWQIVTAYNITMYSIITLVVLFCMFWFKVWRQKKRVKKQKELREYYVGKFHTILGSAEELKPTQILAILEKSQDEVLKNDPYYYAQLLEETRMDMYEIVYLPNMQTLASTLGVCEHFERQLLQRKDVFRTLQMLLMLQLTVSEGRLANYVNHANNEIRMMARLNYITCSSNEPYRYLLEELNQEQSLYRPMILNYIFGWMKFREQRMPNFLDLSDRVEDPHSAAYLLHEVAYWGNDEEKADIKNYFLSEKLPVRSAAIEVATALRDTEAEENLKKSYFHQPEDIRRQVLRALLSMRTGKQTEFFKKAFELSSSRETRETALYCLYEYGNDGRRMFELMRHDADEETRRLIDQVDSIAIISQLQVL